MYSKRQPVSEKHEFYPEIVSGAELVIKDGWGYEDWTSGALYFTRAKGDMPVKVTHRVKSKCGIEWGNGCRGVASVEALKVPEVK